MATMVLRTTGYQPKSISMEERNHSDLPSLLDLFCSPNLTPKRMLEIYVPIDHLCPMP